MGVTFEGAVLLAALHCCTMDPFFVLKGTVHPKMKNLSSFTHGQVVPNQYEFCSFAEHKISYFERIWITRQFMDPSLWTVGAHKLFD